MPNEAQSLPSIHREATLFHRLRWQALGHLISQKLHTARLRSSVLAVVSTGFWIALFWMFGEGFQLMQATVGHIPTRVATVQAIYNTFFLALLVMLAVSSAIILYTGLYRSGEGAFLLTLPTRPERIVLHKFQETIVFSCWGFFLLGTPMLLAYGIVAGSPWYYFALILPFMLSFASIPAATGALACLTIVYLIPKIRMHALVLACALMAFGGLAVAWMILGQSSDDMLTPNWFHTVLGRLQMGEQRWLPSWWLSSGLLEAAHPAGPEINVSSWQECLMFLGVLLSNSLVAQVLVVIIGGKIYRTSYSRLQGFAQPVRRKRIGWIDKVVAGLGYGAPRSLRLIYLKDLKVFMRDPVQWSQFVIFFGLMTLYFLNIPRFNLGATFDRWMVVIGFLNLAVVGLILGTFTTRFIYPLVSLEGRRFWILATAPISRSSVVWSKFVLACWGTFVPCCALILLFDFVLKSFEQSWLLVIVHQITAAILCMGLSGLAVGLGARLPNLRENSPSKIAAGFGGTLNLVLSAAYVLTVVIIVAFPCYYLYNQPLRGPQLDDSWHSWLGLGTPGAVYLAVALDIILGLLATIVPLRLGIRSFNRHEI